MRFVFDFVLLLLLGGGREGARLKYALHWREEELGHAASSNVFTTCGRVSRSLGWSISVARVLVVLLVAVFGVIAAFACWRISLKR